MKKIALTLFAIAVVAVAFIEGWALSADHSHPGFEKAVFKWSSTAFDFGKIKVGTPVSHQFTFTNAGNVPLIISSVQASCGCTVTSYSKEPIAPGSTGFVNATYNAANMGQFNKTVTVYSNTDEGAIQLSIKGEVVAELK